jgi:phage terminase large subunit
VHPFCTNIQTELQNYSWKKDRATGEYTNTPIDKYNHLLDALRYAIQAVEKPNKLKTMSKSLFGF